MLHVFAVRFVQLVELLDDKRWFLCSPLRLTSLTIIAACDLGALFEVNDRSIRTDFFYVLLFDCLANLLEL